MASQRSKRRAASLGVTEKLGYMAVYTDLLGDALDHAIDLQHDEPEGCKMWLTFISALVVLMEDRGIRCPFPIARVSER